MNLTKFIGKIDQEKYPLHEVLYRDCPVFFNEEDYFWFKVEYTENSEVVIHDTVGRVMPIPAEVCSEIANIMFAASRLNYHEKELEEEFMTPSHSTL